VTEIKKKKKKIKKKKKREKKKKKNLGVELKEMNKKLESYTAKGAMQGVTSKKLDEEIQLKIQLEKERNQLQFDIEELKKKA